MDKLEDSFNKFNSFYQSTVCHVCKSFKTTLKRCSGCKLYAYCSKEHQKIHWNYHKQFCKIVTNLLTTNQKPQHHIYDIEGISDVTTLEWRQIRVGVKLLLEQLLDRSLTNAENLVWMFPRICEICRQSKQDILIDCDQCYSVSYCSETHRNQDVNNHEMFCKDLKLCFDVDLYILNNNVIHPEVNFRINSELKQLPSNTVNFVQSCIEIIDESNCFSKVLIGEMFSPILTILHGLERSDLVMNRNFYQDSCTIHLIGASLYEESLPWHLLCTCLFKWIQNIRSMTVVLIGPELSKDNDTICSETLDGGQNYMVLAERKYYHNYILQHSSSDGSSNSKTTPANLIIAFNSGLHEYQGTAVDTWTESLNPLLQQSNVLFIFTAYTIEEIQLDFKRLNDTNQCLQAIIIECEENPYKGSKPIHDWDTHGSPLFYQNNYIIVGKTHC